MPLPFYVCTFIRRDDTYNCQLLPKIKKVKTLGYFFEIISRQSSLVDTIKQMKNGALSLEGKLIILKDQESVKVFLKDTDVVRNDDDMLQFDNNELNNLMYIWMNYQKALYSIITVSLIDTTYVLYGFYEEFYKSDSLLQKQCVITRIKAICDSTYILDNPQGEQIEAMLVDYLCKYPFDIDMWVRLTQLEHSMPWQDPYRMYNYLENALAFDENNIQALLFLAYSQYLHAGELNVDLLARLDKLSGLDPEQLSLIEYAKALNKRHQLDIEYELYLLKSIQLYDKNVKNFWYLADYYANKGDRYKALIYYKSALKNIQYVDIGDESTRKDITDINDFFNYYYRGTSINQDFKEEMEQKITELEKKVFELLN